MSKELSLLFLFGSFDVCKYSTVIFFFSLEGGRVFEIFGGLGWAKMRKFKHLFWQEERELRKIFDGGKFLKTINLVINQWEQKT